MTEDEDRSRQLAVALMGCALGADEHLSSAAILRAFLAAGCAYAAHAGMSPGAIREVLHRSADGLGASLPGGTGT